MIAFNRYKKNPCQPKARNALTSHNTPPIASTQPNARIEKVVAVCALPTHAAPRTISRMPNTRNQPQDFLTCSRPAMRKSEKLVIVLLLFLSRTAVIRFYRFGSTVELISAQERLRSVVGNVKRRSRLWVSYRAPDGHVFC